MSTTQITNSKKTTAQIQNHGKDLVYQGKRQGYTTEVTVAGLPLDPRFDLWNHSPTGFEWGYGGSGPAQLALAILAHHLGDDERAVRLHQQFKHQVVARLPRGAWKLTSSQVQQVVEALERSTPDKEEGT